MIDDFDHFESRDSVNSTVKNCAPNTVITDPSATITKAILAYKKLPGDSAGLDFADFANATALCFTRLDGWSGHIKHLDLRV